MSSENEPSKPSTPPSSAKPEWALTDEEWKQVCRQVTLHLEAEKAYAPTWAPETEDEIRVSQAT